MLTTCCLLFVPFPNTHTFFSFMDETFSLSSCLLFKLTNYYFYIYVDLHGMSDMT